MPDFLNEAKIDFPQTFIYSKNMEMKKPAPVSLPLPPARPTTSRNRILNSSLRKAHENDKLGILDVRILMNDDTHIDTEIQLSELKIWGDRALFYISKMYTGQIEKGQNYDVLKKCVSISIPLTLCCLKRARFIVLVYIIYNDKMGIPCHRAPTKLRRL